MVVADPAAELLDLVRRQGDATSAAASDTDQYAATLIRRRFALALPPPFAGSATVEEPVRPAVGADGPAIAAVKWRTFGTSYRGGVLPDAFLDGRGVVPAASFWTTRATRPPTGSHRLLVWGRPGAVFGYLDCGPAMTDGGDGPASGLVGEVYELYVDPAHQGGGGGTRLLAGAEGWLDEAGFEHLELSTLASNHAAHRFYRVRGWEPTGEVVPVDLGTVAFGEARYRRVRARGRS